MLSPYNIHLNIKISQSFSFKFPPTISYKKKTEMMDDFHALNRQSIKTKYTSKVGDYILVVYIMVGRHQYLKKKRKINQ